MSHSNNTTHYNFPQFISTDTPAWLTDVNGAFSDIDAEIYARQQAIASNTDAITANTAQINTIDGKLTQDELDIATLTGRVATAENNISDNTSNIATHTSQINALATQITNMDASQIAYDNTTSGLTSNDVQSAIDEVSASIGGKTVLWTNETPTGSFNAQSVSVDLGNYSSVTIIYKSAVNTNVIYSKTTICDFTLSNEYSIALEEISQMQSANNPLLLRQRLATITVNAVDFAQAYYKATTGTGSGTASGNSIIPLYIIGIK